MSTQTHPLSTQAVAEAITDAAGLTNGDDLEGGYDPIRWIAEPYSDTDDCNWSEEQLAIVQTLAALRSSLGAAQMLAYRLADLVPDSDGHASRDADKIATAALADLIPLTFRVAYRYLDSLTTDSL